MKVTGASVATACLIERSMMKASSSWRVMVWVSTPSESSTGRMVLHTMAWPRLNSPSVPRSDTKISAGICDGTTSEASAFGMVPKPEVCISTAPRKPPIQAPVTMPTASSSRVQRLDQRREHSVRHVSDELDVIALERGLHDLVPGSPRWLVIHELRNHLQRHCSNDRKTLP